MTLQTQNFSALSSAEETKIMDRINSTFKVEFEPLEVDGVTLEVLSISNMQEHINHLLQARKIHDPLRDLPLWAKIWPSSFILGRFLRKYAREGATLLELGAGMGICSLIAAQYNFGNITITDFDNMALDFAKANILHNNLQDKVSARHLDLTNQQGALPCQYDFIVASEILYLDNLHTPIIKFIDRNLAPGGKAFFCTDMARLKPHFKKLVSKSFAVQEGHIGVKCNEEGEGEQRRIYSVLIVEKK